MSDRRSRLLVALLALATAGVAAALALGPLEGLPHVSDEIVYAIQARLFAHGHRLGHPPAYPGLWDYPFLLTRPGLAAAFPPGWPALLSLGARWHAQAIVNPVLAATIPALTWRIARRLVGSSRAALLAATLAALSPGVLVLAASRMSHTSVLVALLLVADRAAARRLGWVAALALAYVVSARPTDALVAGIPLLFLGGRPRPASLLRVALPAALAAGWVAWDNHLLTGSAFTHPASVSFAHGVPDRPGCNRLGFGPDVGCVPVFGSYGYTPLKALRQTWRTAVVWDRLLLGVPGGGIFALAGMWVLGRRHPAALAVLLAVPLFHAMYWSPGLAYGARFWHALYVLAPTAIAIVLVRLPGRLPWLFALVLPLSALPPLGTTLSQSYWCVDGALRDGLRRHGIDHGVVFVKSMGTRRVDWPLLGVTGFTCTPMLDTGHAWALEDLTPGAPLQLRHLPREPDGPKIWLRHNLPNGPAWAVYHDIPHDLWGIASIDPETGTPGPIQPF